MRYIIETATLHANLLNRTLVVPSYVYARSCELKMSGKPFFQDQRILTSSVTVKSVRRMRQW